MSADPAAASGCSDIGGRVSPPFDQLLLNVTPKKEHLPGAAAQELACLLSARRGMPTQAVCYRPSPFPKNIGRRTSKTTVTKTRLEAATGCRTYRASVSASHTPSGMPV